MNPKKWILLVLVTFVLIQFSASLVSNVSDADDWPMFRHDLNHSGLASSIPANSYKLLWNYTTDGSVWSSPAVTGGLVFVGSKDKYIYCINASTGTLAWKFPTEGQVDSSPSVDGDYVFIASDDGWLYTLNVTSGMPIWIKFVGWNYYQYSSRSSPTVYDGKVYIGSGQHNLFCFNESDGSAVWTWKHDYPISTSPAISESTVYVSSDDRYLHALNATNGAEMWQSRTVSQISSACLMDGYLYVGSYDGDVACVNASDGQIKWRFQTGDTIISSPAAAYGCVYFGSEDSNVYCLNASSGQKIWQTKTGYWVCSSPAVAEGNIYIGSEDYSMYCLNATTGAVKWSFQTGNYIDSSPAVVGNTLYFGSHDHNVYALSLHPNQEQTKTASPIVLSTVIFDAIACAIAGATIFGIYWLRKQDKINNEAVNPKGKTPWYIIHGDALCLLVILLFSILFFVDFGRGVLWEADEKTYTQMAYHMFKTGDYFTPYCFGDLGIWTGKPPVLMWVMSLSYQVFGVSSFSARFTVDVFGALSLVAVYFLGRKLFNRWVGLMSALILGTFASFFEYATHAMTDVPLVFFVCASLYFLIQSQDAKKPLPYAALSGLFFGLALLTKQTEALLIPLITIAYFIITKKNDRFLSKRLGSFFGAALLIFVPWLIQMSLRFGDYFWKSYFTYSTLLRVVSPLEGHTGGPLYYVNYLARNETLLWVVLLPFATALCVYLAVRRRSKSDILLLTWMVAVFAVFTIAQTKLHYYILPVYPAFALAIASLIYKTSEKIVLRLRQPKTS
jgi:eukaryotic-like serine/threonine-protein kinase